MTGLAALQVGVLFSAAFALIALLAQVARTLSYGMRPQYAKPQGRSWRGVFYAFGLGMMPWEKESTRKHIPTLVAGTIYHFAILAALLLLILQSISTHELDGEFGAFAPIFLAGVGSGIALLARRTVKPHLRQLSSPDDFIANLLVDLFLAAALASTMSVALQPLFLAAAILLFLYLPMGKIRHCIFFFYSRILFGIFFGKRGTLPQRADGV